jgi:putative transposase
MRDVCADFGAELREFNGEPEHVHLLVNFPPTVAISRLITRLRACRPAGCGRNSRTWAATTGEPGDCGPGSYFAGSVGGAPISVLRQYIEQQNRPA